MTQPVYNILDTETTGFSHMDGDRIIEIGVIRLEGVNEVDQFHVLIQPNRDVPASSTEVHGITDAMLRGKPTFEQIADEFLAFIGDAPLVIHNAPFDMGFLQAELTLAKKPRIKNTVHDTLEMARRKFPGSPATLDALAKRFRHENLRKTTADGYHGALVDARMLAQIFIDLSGGRQSSLTLAAGKSDTPILVNASRARAGGGIVIPANDDEIRAHADFIKDSLKNPIWSAA